MAGVQSLQVPDRGDLEAGLTFFHSSKLTGHFAIKRTTSKIQEAYHWTCITKDVTKFVRRCVECQVKGNHPKEAGVQLLRPIPISEPFAGVGMDLLGPLQTTRRGHRFTNCTDRLTSRNGSSSDPC